MSLKRFRFIFFFLFEKPFYSFIGFFCVKKLQLFSTYVYEAFMASYGDAITSNFTGFFFFQMMLIMNEFQFTFFWCCLCIKLFGWMFLWPVCFVCHLRSSAVLFAICRKPVFIAWKRKAFFHFAGISFFFACGNFHKSTTFFFFICFLLRNHFLVKI